MRRTTPRVRQVLLDDSFVNALLATDAPAHAAACVLYGELVDNYERGHDRLFALSSVLGDVPREFRRSALAPVATLHVAAQHQSAAMATGHATPRAALSLVMMRRERIGAVATATNEFDAFDVEVLSVAPFQENSFETPVRSDHRNFEPATSTPPASAPAAFAPPSAGPVNSGTAPPPAPRSTDG